jgi:predicted phage tail protein
MAEAFKFPDEQDESQGQTVDLDAGDTEIEIEVVDDTPERDRGRKPLDREVADPTDDEIESYSDNVKKRIKDLTHARHDERRAKEALLREKQELERLAQHMVAENNKLKQYVNNGSEHYAASMKHIAENEVDKAKRALKEANESFDTEAIIAAQEALMDAKMKAEAAKNFRPTPLQLDADTVQIPQTRETAPAVDEKTLRWQAKNQWFGASGFEELTSFALGLHQKLVNSGIDPRSEEYFERIDSRMKSTFPDVFGDDRPKSGDSSKRRSTVVAPATRSSGVRKVQLTNTQLALAQKYGLTPQQYAAEVAKLEK